MALTQVPQTMLTGVPVSFNANTSVTAGSTSTPLTYSVEDTDTDNAFNGTTFTCPTGKGGEYEFGANYYFGATATYGSIYVNGTEAVQGTNTIASAGAGNVFGKVTLAAGDTVQIRPGAAATAITGSKVNRFWGKSVKSY